jgi:hypothetical protein
MPVRHVADVEAKTVAGARDMTIQVLISAQEGFKGRIVSAAFVKRPFALRASC